MASESILCFWGLLPLIVPLVAGGLGHESRVDRFFFAGCTLLTFLLLGFLPRPSWSSGVWIAATFAVSGVVAMVYLALAPAARQSWRGLLAVIGTIDIAGLGVAHVSTALGMHRLWLLALLLGVTACVGLGAVLAARWLARTGGVEPR